jgi:hypothetical protein
MNKTEAFLRDYAALVRRTGMYVDPEAGIAHPVETPENRMDSPEQHIERLYRDERLTYHPPLHGDGEPVTGEDYDLAILHVVDAGGDYGRRVRLTRKAEPGQIGHDLVFEFYDRTDVDDLLRQLREVALHAWGAEGGIEANRKRVAKRIKDESSALERVTGLADEAQSIARQMRGE